MKTAVISGVTGMDGSIMSAKLLDLGFKVYGLVRQSATPNYWRLEEMGVMGDPNFELKICDIVDYNAVSNVINEIKPDWCINFAAMSQVGTSFDSPLSTLQTDAIGPVNFLEAIRRFSPKTKFYTASSSEMYGQSKNSYGVSDEKTPFIPVSPYAAAKTLAHDMVRIYRDSYGLFACAGILFNHSCKLRGDYFVEKKICKYVAKLVTNTLEDGELLLLGNLDSSRDIGYAGDYIAGIIYMMEEDEPDDYVLCTGLTHTIRDLVALAFDLAGYTNWHDYVKEDDQFKRPNELHVLVGNHAKAANKLGWTPKWSIDDILKEIIEFEVKKIENGRKVLSS